MRKFVTTTLFIALATTTAIYADSPQESNGPVIAISELTNEMIGDFFQTKSSPFILECAEGTMLPFDLSIQSEFLTLAADEASRTIHIIKTCYIKSVDGTYFFSCDLRHWQEFEDFFSGYMGLVLHVNNGTPMLNLNVGLSQRTIN